MSKQIIIRTTIEDDEVLNRARKRIKIGQIAYYQDKKLKKVKEGWQEVDKNAFASIIIIQV